MMVRDDFILTKIPDFLPDELGGIMPERPEALRRAMAFEDFAWLWEACHLRLIILQSGWSFLKRPIEDKFCVHHGPTLGVASAVKDNVLITPENESIVSHVLLRAWESPPDPPNRVLVFEDRGWEDKRPIGYGFDYLLRWFENWFGAEVIGIDRIREIKDEFHIDDDFIAKHDMLPGQYVSDVIRWGFDALSKARFYVIKVFVHKVDATVLMSKYTITYAGGSSMRDDRRVEEKYERPAALNDLNDLLREDYGDMYNGTIIDSLTGRIEFAPHGKDADTSLMGTLTWGRLAKWVRRVDLYVVLRIEYKNFYHKYDIGDWGLDHDPSAIQEDTKETKRFLVRISEWFRPEDDESGENGYVDVFQIKRAIDAAWSTMGWTDWRGQIPKTESEVGWAEPGVLGYHGTGSYHAYVQGMYLGVSIDDKFNCEPVDKDQGG